MELKEIERITLAVMKKIAKEEFGDDFDVDAPVDPDDMSFMVKVMSGFLAAVDAERGKDAVSYDEIFNAIAEAASPCGEGIGVSVMAFKRAIGGEIFISPTIPLGFALVPIGPSEEWIAKVTRVNQPDLDIGCRAWREEVGSLEYWHKAMIQAAGVTK